MWRGRVSGRQVAALIAAVAVFGLGLGAGPASARPALIRAFGRGAGAGRLDDPIGVTAGYHGWIYVADAKNDRVDQFSAGGTFLRAWEWGVRDGTHAFQICTSPCQKGVAGSGAGQFDVPWGIAADGAGRVYVTDSGSNRVEEFSGTGSYLSQFGSTGTAAGRFEDPLGVAAMPGGGIDVVDSGNARIDKFSRRHTFVRAWGWGVVDGQHGKGGRSSAGGGRGCSRTPSGSPSTRWGGSTWGIGTTTGSTASTRRAGYSPGGVRPSCTTRPGSPGCRTGWWWPTRATTASSSTRSTADGGRATARTWRRLAGPRDVAQPGSAPALGAGGRQFESDRPDLCWSQVRAPPC